MESVNDYIFPYLNPTTFGRIMALQEDRARGLCSEIDVQETILNMLKNENGLSAVKQALNRDFQLNSKITDHFLARLVARHGNDCIDFIMRKVEYGINRSRRSGASKIFAHDCAITYDPQKNTLISIYPKISLV